MVNILVAVVPLPVLLALVLALAQVLLLLSTVEAEMKFPTARNPERSKAPSAGPGVP